MGKATGGRRARRRAVAALAAATMLGACGRGRERTQRSTPLQTVPPQASSSSGRITVSAPAPAERPSVRSVVDRRLTAIAHRLPAGAISVAALNTTTGATYRFGETGGMWTGSVYKLLVLETLLLQRQHSGAWLTDDELADVSAMIESSNNRAGYRMYLAAGGRPALAAAARRLGLRHTRPGVSDPSFTTTDAGDGITLLRNLVDGGPLDARCKAFVLGLMRNVQADQRWGVGVVADPGTGFANKNGWLQVDDGNGPGEDDGGRWLVNSLGVVRVGGQRVLLAIFTRHDRDFASGIELVQELARTITPVVVPTR